VVSAEKAKKAGVMPARVGVMRKMHDRRAMPAAAIPRQCNRTAESKYQVRRISTTSNSRASAGGNAG
jgi:hypothetical protein